MPEQAAEPGLGREGPTPGAALVKPPGVTEERHRGFGGAPGNLPLGVAAIARAVFSSRGWETQGRSSREPIGIIFFKKELALVLFSRWKHQTHT